jgi:acyl-CoA dehydrogenase
VSDTQVDDLATVRDAARRLLHEQISGERLEKLLDEPGAFDLRLWRLAAEQGWLEMALPEADGGAGLGWAGVATLAEELGRAAAALPLIPAALAASIAPGHGNELVCIALAGPRLGQLSGSDALRSEGDCLHGEVSTVAFGAIANTALVTAMDGRRQESLWLVSLETPQASRELVPTLDNSRAVATLRFAGAPATLLGGGALVARLIDYAATLTAFEQLGGAQASLALASQHALDRHAFGQPIARFQAIKHKLVEIYAAIEIASGCARTALDLLRDDAEVSERHEAAATARVAASQAYEQAARECINIFGALGLTREAAPHRHYRRARSLALELGSTPVWRESLVQHFLHRVVGATGVPT